MAPPRSRARPAATRALRLPTSSQVMTAMITREPPMRITRKAGEDSPARKLKAMPGLREFTRKKKR